MKIREFFKSLTIADYVFIITLVIILFSILAFYLVDLRNVFGLRDALFSVSPVYFYSTYHPFFFHHWGKDAGIAEILQTILLGGSLIVSAFCAGRLSLYEKKFSRFWTIMSVFFLLLILENTTDVRHVLMGYVQAIFDEPDQGVMGTLTELLYFGSLAAILIYALVKYWSLIKSFARMKFYLVIGFIGFGFGTILSFSGTAFDNLLGQNLYVVLGERFYSLAIALGDPALASQWESWESQRSFPIGFFLMDSFVEENLELLGAAGLLAAVLSFLIAMQGDKFKKKK